VHKNHENKLGLRIILSAINLPQQDLVLFVVYNEKKPYFTVYLHDNQSTCCGQLFDSLQVCYNSHCHIASIFFSAFLGTEIYLFYLISYNHFC